MNIFSRAVHKTKVIIRWASIWSVRITRFLTRDIWNLRAEDFTNLGNRLIRDVKTVLLMMNTFSAQKIGFQVSALSYRSMMSIVPALAIGFYLTAGVGLSAQFSELLYANISDQHLIDMLLTAADNILTTAESGLFGFISMFSFFWIVIWLMVSVRRVFNNVWNVKESNYLKMAGGVIGVVLLSPFVIALFFSGSVVYSHVLDLLVPERFAFSESLKSFVSWVIFAAVAVLVMTVMYKFIPATKVKYRHAFKAAVFSGIIFTVIQYLYLETQVMVAKQSAVYGVLASIPLFMIWLNLGWTIVLYGAELSYAFQNVDSHNVTGEQIDQWTREAIHRRAERMKLKNRTQEQ